MFTTAPIAVLVSAVATALGILAPVAPHTAAHPAPGVAGVTDHEIVTGRSETLRYWTSERMQRALVPPARPRPTPMAGSPAAGPPITIPPTSAVTGTGTAPMGERVSVESPGAPWTSRGAVRATTGKVFFTIDGADYVCSAGTVTGANHDLVVTAGHCTLDASGSWAHNWIYVPGYDQGRRPYGAFTARHVYLPDAWSKRGDENYDVALVALATSAGRHITDVVGAQGIAFDQPRGTLVYSFGYPSGGRYDGERLTYCSGRTYPDSHKITRDEGLRCDMTEGSSGGPWLAKFDAGTGTGVVTSVSSFKYADDPATMYGPYFSAAIHRVYNAAQRA